MQRFNFKKLILLLLININCTVITYDNQNVIQVFFIVRYKKFKLLYPKIFFSKKKLVICACQSLFNLPCIKKNKFRITVLDHKNNDRILTNIDGIRLGDIEKQNVVTINVKIIPKQPIRI